MQLPLLPGTILQNRYCLLQVLGQGGFGRTYLVEDQARFNELCVLKEYNPKNTGTYALRKSEELFQREAKTLYQIQHPQIPEFRATFEQDERLFLVQDYIKGQTYRTLLNERQQEGKTFSEAEMRQFLLQILPVLAHIHSKGIIHRDISPENIICRDSDGLPVLIDFGTVKQRILESESASNDPAETAVGKAGYAPPEQLQGIVYFSSDFYALAVTIIVLMTGRKPQDLFNESTIPWQKKVPPPGICISFATILNRMHHFDSLKRYPSATELQQALDTFLSPLPPTTPTTSTKSTPGTTCTITKSEPPSQTERFLLLAGAGLTLLFFLFFNSCNRPKLPPKPRRTTPPTTARTPSPNIPEKPPVIPLRGNRLLPKQSYSYFFDCQAGQRMEAYVKEGSVLMRLYHPNPEIVTRPVNRLDGVLPATGSYKLEVSLDERSGITESAYTIEVRLYPIN